MTDASKSWDTTRFLRGLLLGSVSLLGSGYIMVNAAVALVLGYIISGLRISSINNVTRISGLLMFLFASLLLIVIGGLMILGAVRYYRRRSLSDVLFLTVMVGSFYLLCLGVGSAIAVSVAVSVALIVGAVLVMVGTAFYMMSSPTFKIAGSILGMASGLLLGIFVSVLHPLELALDWNVPFYGVFMSLAFLEGIVILLGSVTAFLHFVLAKRKEASLVYILVAIIALVYGVSVFVGPLYLSFGFLDLLWKAKWVGPFHNVPVWVLTTGVFWSASLIILSIGGVVLIVYSFVKLAHEAGRLQASSTQVPASSTVSETSVPSVEAPPAPPTEADLTVPEFEAYGTEESPKSSEREVPAAPDTQEAPETYATPEAVVEAVAPSAAPEAHDNVGPTGAYETPEALEDYQGSVTPEDHVTVETREAVTPSEASETTPASETSRDLAAPYGDRSHEGVGPVVPTLDLRRLERLKRGDVDSSRSEGSEGSEGSDGEGSSAEGLASDSSEASEAHEEGSSSEESDGSDS